MDSKQEFYNDPLFYTLEKQAKGFEEFGKRMSLELQSCYQEYIKRKQQGKKFVESTKVKECECKKKVREQERLIDSLMSRLESLENYFIPIYGQELKNLKIKRDDKIKKEFESFNNDDISEDNEKNQFEDSIEHENENLTKIDDDDDIDDAESSESFKATDSKILDHRNSRIVSNELIGKQEIKESKESKNSSKQDDQIEKLQNPPTYTITMNEIIKKYTESQDSRQKTKENSLIPKSLEISLSDNSPSYPSKTRSRRRRKRKIKEIEETKESNEINETNKTTSTIEQIHSQIQDIIAQMENNDMEFKQKHFKVLKKSFTIKDIILYTRTKYFSSLKRSPKKILNRFIKESLSNEFNQQNVILSQDLKEYINRGIIPALPSEYNNYTTYEEGTKLAGLKKSLKGRVRKLIILEKEKNLN